MPEGERNLWPGEPDARIDIIEGPTPLFEPAMDYWPDRLKEGPYNTHIPFMTRLRTHNARKLVERCYGAWHRSESIFLHFRSEEYNEDTGYLRRAPILAARAVDTDNGSIILLWVAIERDEIEFSDDDAQNLI